MTVINGKELLEYAPIKTMLSAKARSANGVSHGLAEVGYDIRIKQNVYFRDGRHASYDPTEHSEHFVPKWHTGNFLISSAIEEFHMPNNLTGIVHDKSTWARKGLSVFNTVIEPCWKGFLTLELVYHGREELIIPAGSGIAQVIFHQLWHPAEYTGPYQDQEDKPVRSLVDAI